MQMPLEGKEKELTGMVWSEECETEAVLVAALWAGLEKGEGRMLQKNKTVALGGVRGYIFRQVPDMIMLALKARRKANTDAGGEASALLTAFPYVLGTFQFKAEAKMDDARLRCSAAAAPSCSPSRGTVPGVPDLPTAPGPPS